MVKQELETMTPESEWVPASRGQATAVAIANGTVYVIGNDSRVYHQELDTMTPASSWGQPIAWDVTAIAIYGNCMYYTKRDLCLYMQGLDECDGNTFGDQPSATCYPSGYALELATHQDVPVARGFALALAVDAAADDGGILYAMGKDFDLYMQPLRGMNTESRWSRIAMPNVVPRSITQRILHDCVRIVCISDTHGRHRELDAQTLSCDILIHAGDMTRDGSAKNVEDVAAWFDFFQQRGHVKHVVAVAGNHDMIFQTQEASESITKVCTYLQDTSAVVQGIRFYGSPWVPHYHGFASHCNAFTLPLGEPLHEKWADIPEAIDVLITHGPPAGHGDRLRNGKCAGCPDLLGAIQQMLPNPPRLVVSGHIHST